MTNETWERDDSPYEELAAKHVSMRRVLGLFGAYVGRLIAVLVLIVLSSAAGVATPFLLQAIIDDALPNGNLMLLALLAGGLVGLACFGTVIGVLQVAITSKVGQAIIRRHRPGLLLFQDADDLFL